MGCHHCLTVASSRTRAPAEGIGPARLPSCSPRSAKRSAEKPGDDVGTATTPVTSLGPAQGHDSRPMFTAIPATSHRHFRPRRRGSHPSTSIPALLPLPDDGRGGSDRALGLVKVATNPPSVTGRVHFASENRSSFVTHDGVVFVEQVPPPVVAEDSGALVSRRCSVNMIVVSTRSAPNTPRTPLTNPRSRRPRRGVADPIESICARQLDGVCSGMCRRM